MNVLLRVVVSARVSKKRQEHQAEHVERRQARSDEADNPQRGMPFERATENLVLAEKSRERRNSRDGQRGKHKGPRRNRDLAPEAAHFLDVLLAGHGLDHAACTKEQECIEEGVRHQMENTGRKRARTELQRQVAELA